MDSSQLVQAITAGNDVAMQWYALTHAQQLPSAGTVTYQPSATGGGSLQIGFGALLVIGLGLVAVIYLAKD